MNHSEPLLVLYSRIDAFGDGLLRIPALRAARTAFPDSRIVYGCSGPSTLEKLLRRHVDHLVDSFRTHSPLPQILAEFGERGGTSVADFRNLTPQLVGMRARLLGSQVDYEANFPGFALSWPRRKIMPRPEHNAWRYHRMIERLAGRPLPFDHRLHVTASARAEAARLRGADQRPLVLMTANGAGDQRLGSEQVARVAGGLADSGYRVLHLLTPGDGPSAQTLVSLEPRIEVVGPRPGLEDTALDDLFLALGEVADAYIGCDGGMAHLMATVMTPIVIINRGFKIERWRPLSNFVEIVEARTENASGLVRDTPPEIILAAAHRLFAARARDRATGSMVSTA